MWKFLSCVGCVCSKDCVGCLGCVGCVGCVCCVGSVGCIDFVKWSQEKVVLVE